MNAVLPEIQRAGWRLTLMAAQVTDLREALDMRSRPATPERPAWVEARVEHVEGLLLGFVAEAAWPTPDEGEPIIAGAAPRDRSAHGLIVEGLMDAAEALWGHGLDAQAERVIAAAGRVYRIYLQALLRPTVIAGGAP